MKRTFKKLTPDQGKLVKNPVLKPIAHLLTKPQIWHFNRRTIAYGVAIGVFFGSLPIAGQMLLAAVVAVMTRVNMPIAVASTWISNPLTMPFFYTGNYYFGAWLLRRESIKMNEIDWSLNGLLSLGGEVLVPLYLGSITIGVILAFLAFIAVRVLWRLHVVSHHRSRSERCRKKSESQ